MQRIVLLGVLAVLSTVSLASDEKALAASGAVRGDGGSSGTRAVVDSRQQLGGANELGSFPAGCANSIEDDANPGTCLQASTTPTLGRLHPISANLFVAVSGEVGIGTTSPSARLHVAGTGRITDTLTLAPSGDQALNLSTGNIYKGGALFLHTTGGANTGLGREALSSVTLGFLNTASGYRALLSNTIGYRNTASGAYALTSNIDGSYNTASGARALYSNTSGHRNTASGSRALYFNTTGNRNTASGSMALYSNTTGILNTACGFYALRWNTFGNLNTACGIEALFNNTTGSRNIALGNRAGSNLTTGNDNIAIGNLAVAGESGTIRIGSTSHTRAFIAGIRGATTGVADAIPVLIDSDGQLGTVSSSRRFKEEITDMGDLTDRLLELRPVAFRYKAEVQAGERPLEYGLIAEEVAEIFPDLVVYDEEGKPFTVKYHLLSSMLLNELEKMNARLTRELADHAEELKELRSRLTAVETRASPLAPDQELLEGSK